MRPYFLLLFAITTLLAQAQKLPDPRSFGSSITEEGLKTHLYIIAGKDFEGRETATQGQRLAAAYIQSAFKSYGLAPGFNGDYQMPYPVFQDSLVGASMAVNGHPFELNEDFDVNISASYSATIMSSEIVFAGYGISDSARDDYEGLDVKGKVVLLLNSLPPDRLQAQINRRRFNPYGKQDAAQKHGAIAVLIVQDDFPRKQRVAKSNMHMTGFKKITRPDTYYISPKLARALMGEDFDKINLSDPKPKSYPANLLLQLNLTTVQLQSTDVLGYLEGTDLKDQLLVISAHYDHLGKKDTVIYYGADDDGSGTVSILALAEAFSKAKAAGKGPRRSILFLANSGEEEGLWGSEFYTDHPVYPLDKTTADLNIDMIGRIDPGRDHGDSTNYIYVVGDDKMSTDLRPISVKINTMYTKLELDYKFNDPHDPERIFFRSDHYNFARYGVPIIFYFDGIHHDYHQPTDTPDKINYDILRKRAQFVFYTAWEMANRDDMLKRDIPLK
jgi:hypothetical protein